MGINLESLRQYRGKFAQTPSALLLLGTPQAPGNNLSHLLKERSCLEDERDESQSNVLNGVASKDGGTLTKMDEKWTKISRLERFPVWEFERVIPFTCH